MSRFLTTNEAAEILTEQYEYPMSKRTLEGLRCKQLGPSYFKVGKYVMYKEPDLAKWVRDSIEHVIIQNGHQR